MTVNKDKFKIIKEGSKKYILASEVTEYAKEHLNTSFGIPSYRTLRYYVTEGVIPRPEKRGKETYFELQFMLYFFMLLKKLHPFNPPLSRIRNIVSNTRKHNQWERIFNLLDSTSYKPDVIVKEKEKVLMMLECKSHSGIKLKD